MKIIKKPEGSEGFSEKSIYENGYIEFNKSLPLVSCGECKQKWGSMVVSPTKIIQPIEQRIAKWKKVFKIDQYLKNIPEYGINLGMNDFIPGAQYSPKCYEINNDNINSLSFLWPLGFPVLVVNENIVKILSNNKIQTITYELIEKVINKQTMITSPKLYIVFPNVVYYEKKKIQRCEKCGYISTDFDEDEYLDNINIHELHGAVEKNEIVSLEKYGYFAISDKLCKIFDDNNFNNASILDL